MERRGIARAGARTPRSPARRSSTGRRGRRGGRGSRAARRRAQPVARARRRRPRARRTPRRRRRSGSRGRRARRPRRGRAAPRSTSTNAARQCSVWKPTLSHASSPSWIARAIAGGSTAQASGPDPRDVREVRDPRRRAARRGRARARGRGGSPGRRPARPGRGRAPRRRPPRAHGWPRRSPSRHGRVEVGVGIVLQVPQTVLDEPQHGVRDHAVEAAGRRRGRGRRAGARTASPTPSAPCARPGPAISRSTSPIALATQVTSFRSTSGRSAVTRPPAPRDASSAPSAPRRKPTGPRFETTISGSRRSASQPDAGRLPSVTSIDDAPLAAQHGEGDRLARARASSSRAARRRRRSSTFVPPIATIRSPPSVTSRPLKASVRAPPRKPGASRPASRPRRA